MKCSMCGDRLSGEERDNPRRDPADGKPLCDDCYREAYEDVCCRCENIVEKSELESEPGRLIVHMNPQRKDDPPRGYYRVKRWPIFGGSLLGGHMFFDALEFAAPLEPGRKFDDGYTAGPICDACQDEVNAAIREATHRRVKLRMRLIKRRIKHFPVDKIPRDTVRITAY